MEIFGVDFKGGILLLRKQLIYWVMLILGIGLAFNVYGEGMTSATSSVRVYTAGSYKDGNKEIACFWTNTKKIDLPGKNGKVNSIFVK